jgi:hypothetical protein
VRLITAIQSSKNLREAALDLLRIDAEPYAVHVLHRLGFPPDRRPRFDDEVQKRLANASENETEDICKFLVGAFPFSSVPAFEVHRTNSSYTCSATLGIHSLMTALYWMVWQDIFMENPFQFCEECSRLIPQTTKHERKFCSTECARRKTGREWQQRKRAKEKKNNGTRKAR